MPDRTTKVTLLAEVNGYLSGMRQARSATSQMSDEAKAKLEKQSQSMQAVGHAAMAMGAIAAAGVALAVKKFADFDQAMSYVDAAMHETTGNMSLLRDAAIDAGARTVFSATEAANAIEELGKAGVSTKDILAGGLDGALDLAAAGGLGVADAAAIAATALTVFGLKGKDMSHVADLLAAGAGKAQGSVEDLSQGMKFVGPVAAGMGISIDETVGTLAAFASQGILADQAGTGLRGMLSSLTSPSKTATAELDELGVSLYDGQGKFLGLANMAGELEKAYKGMSDQEKDTSLGIIFGNQQITAARVLLKEGKQGVDEWTDSVNDQGFAAETAARRLDNLAGDVEQLGGSIDTALIKSGSAANETLRGLTQMATELVNRIGDIPGPVLAVGIGFTALAAGTLIVGGGFLTLIPKIAATRAAMNSLHLTGKSLALTLGKGGLLMAAVAVATTAFTGMGRVGELSADGVAELEASFKRMGGLDNTLDRMFAGMQGTTNATNGFKEAAEKLTSSGLDGFMYQVNKTTWGAMDAVLGWIPAVKDLDNGITKNESQFKQLGKTMAELAKTDLPSATNQFKNMLELMGGGKENAEKLMKVLGSDYKAALIELASAAGGATDDQSILNLAMGKGELAGQLMTRSAKENASALSVLTGKAADANGEISGLADTIKDFGAGTLDTAAAQRDFEQAVDDAAAAMKENGKTLDITTEKGRNNQASIDDIAKSTLAVASSQAEAGATGEALAATLEKGRDAFVKSAVAAGMTEAAAKKLADQYGLIPENVNTAIKLNTTPADAAMEAFMNRWNGKTVNLTATGSGKLGSGILGKADGGAIVGSGGPREDNILFRGSNGEHVLDAEDVKRMGGQEGVYRFRASLYGGYADGGALQFQPAPVYTPAPPRMYMPGPGAAFGGNRSVTNNVVANNVDVDELVTKLDNRSNWSLRRLM